MPTDTELIAQVRSGQHEAYSLLFRRYYPSIYALCLSNLHHPQDAEEVAQESFVQAYLKLDQLRDSERFLAWLQCIARNRCCDWQRGAHPEHVPLEWASVPTVSTTPEDYLLRQELMDAIQEAIAALSVKDRAVIQAYLDGLEHRDIGELCLPPLSRQK